MTEEDDDIASLGLFDKANPRSMINIAPVEMRQALERMDKRILLMDEQELKRKTKPSSTLNYLRLNFWLEYNHAQDARKTMRLAPILRGVTHGDYLLGVVLQDDKKIAWMVTPPVDYALVQRDILDTALEKLRRALAVQLYKITEKEKWDGEGNRVVTRTKVANVGAMVEIRRIAEFLSDRVQGAVVQRVAIKSQSEHLGLGAGPQAPQLFDPSTLDTLNRQLEETQRLLASAEAQPPITETVVAGEVVEASYVEAEEDA